MSAASFRHSFQRCNCARLSAPISQINRRFGQRRRILVSVSTVYRVPKATSSALTRTGARRACCRAEAIRAGRGAMSAPSFSGLPGETSHHASSSPSAASAARVIRRWPPCAGLKLPPSSRVYGPRRVFIETPRAASGPRSQSAPQLSPRGPPGSQPSPRGPSGSQPPLRGASGSQLSPRGPSGSQLPLRGASGSQLAPVARQGRNWPLPRTTHL